MTSRYDDILHLPHPTSTKHPRMPVSDRAAIFSPFAALSGHGAAIAETARLTDQRIELDEDSRAVLDEKQRFLETIADQQPEVTVTWFQPDERKEGGCYVTTTGKLKRTDTTERVMTFTEGMKIPLDDIIDIDSDWFPETVQDKF